MSDPLEDAFNLPSSSKDEGNENDPIFSLNIPEDASLNDISKIALETFRSQLADIQHMEPKFRARAFEVAQLYLQIATNAVAHKEDNRIKQAKLELDRAKANLDKKKDKDEGKIGTRKEVLMEIAKQNKQVK